MKEAGKNCSHFKKGSHPDDEKLGELFIIL